MGLLKALSGATGGVLADQWKEYFYCDALDADTLVVKGSKRVSGRSSNTKAMDNIISTGSIIAIADGQCMLIVEQGKVVELCAVAGEYIYDASTEPTIMAGNLSTSIPDVFRNIGKRFTFGGEAPKDQRVYYVNTKEIMGNKYGTPNPVPFRVVDRNISLDVDISIRCYGEYSYRITNPILFYTNVCGNVSTSYDRSQIDGQLKTELLTALQPAFGEISEKGIRYSALPNHTMEMAEAMNKVLSAKWKDLRGVEVVSMGVSSVKASEEDEAMIKGLQRSAVYRDPGMAAAMMVDAQAEAMKLAATNSGGAMTGFMGMGMAQKAGGIDATALFQMNQQRTAAQPAAQPEASANGWKCACGHTATGNFCPECGAKKPEAGWTCACGNVNKGKFCSNCGAKKPAAAPLYRCDQCGWEPEDPKNPPKFCPECGDRFGDEDIR